MDPGVFRVCIKEEPEDEPSTVESNGWIQEEAHNMASECYKVCIKEEPEDFQNNGWIEDKEDTIDIEGIRISIKKEPVDPAYEHYESVAEMEGNINSNGFEVSIKVEPEDVTASYGHTILMEDEPEGAMDHDDAEECPGQSVVPSPRRKPTHLKRGHKVENRSKGAVKQRRRSEMKKTKNENANTTGRSNTLYLCIHCDKLFTDHNALIKHEEKHTLKVGIYKCQYCSKTYTFFNSLMEHELAAHTDTSHFWEFQCQLCAKIFADGKYLEKHLKKHTENAKKLLKVDLTSKETSNVVEKRVQEKLYPKYPDSNVVDKLVQEKLYPKYPDSNVCYKRFNCKYCFKSFAQIRYLQQHLYRYPCRKNMQEKRRVATIDVRDLKYRCQYCPESFSRYRSLHQHESLHEGDEDLLKKKVDKNDQAISDVGEMQYRCRYCPKSFTRSRLLQQHEALHNGEEDLQENKVDLVNQVKSNIFEKFPHRHRCKDCSKFFGCHSSLKEHEKVHKIGNYNELPGLSACDGLYQYQSFSHLKAVKEQERHTAEVEEASASQATPNIGSTLVAKELPEDLQWSNGPKKEKISTSKLGKLNLQTSICPDDVS